MKSLLLLLVFACTSVMYSQPNVITYYEYTSDGYDLFADNKEDYSVIVELDFDLRNLKVVREGPSEIVVPANTNRFKLVDLVTINVLKLYDFKHTATVRKNDKAIQRIFTEEPLAAEEREIDPDAVVRMSTEENKQVKQKVPEFPIDKLGEEVISDDAVKEEVVAEIEETIKDPEVQQASEVTVIKDLDQSNKDVVLTTKPKVAIGKPVKTTEIQADVAKTPDVVVKEIVKPTPNTAVPKVDVKTEVISKPISKEIETAPEVAIGKPIKTTEIQAEVVKTPAVVAAKEILKPTPNMAVPKVDVKPEVVSKPISKEIETAPELTIDTAVKTVEVQAEVVKAPAVVAAKEILKPTPNMAVPKVDVKPEVVSKPISKEIETAPELTIDTAVKTVEVQAEVVKAPAVVAKEIAKPTSKEVVVAPETVMPEKTTPVIEEKPLPPYDTSAKFSSAYQYNLPFKKGGNYLISQGYFTKGSHANIFALDFAMPEGTQVLAAREGQVVEVVQKNLRGCDSEACKNSDNYILILHPDGSYAKYGHLKQNGAAVAKGDIVAVDQMLAYSGNTGWSTTPSLHFEVYRDTDKGKKTYRTNFRVRDGKDYSVLMEQQYYERNYD